MERFSVAATQVTSKYRDLEYNIETHLRIIKETAEAGCRWDSTVTVRTLEARTFLTQKGR